jgi:SAM-dependent methyltransferase
MHSDTQPIASNPAPAQPPAPARPALDERTRYVPRSRQERFIVPLLARAIDDALDRYAATPARPGAAALDVGCGGQPLRSSLERRGFSYVGLDTQAQPGVDTRYICAIDHTLPDKLLSVGGFDLIVCTEVLEHVADWPTAFDNLRKLAAPGATVLITCPHVYPLHEEPFDFFRPTTHAIAAFADRFGFEVLELRRLGDAFDVLGTLLAASAPASAGLGPLGALAAALARPARSLMIWTLGLGAFRRVLKPKGGVYLSNLAVLRAPRAGGANGAGGASGPVELGVTKA